METITRNVSDIPAGDLPALEHLVGSALRPNQQVIVQVIDKEAAPDNAPLDADVPQLPEWFNVYEGLSDEEIDQLDAAIQQRLDLTRDIDL
jgi:hypothetical protein